MPIDPKDIAAYIGADPETFETPEAFKEHFDTTYLKRELAHTDKDVASKVFGKVNGTLRNNLKGAAKDLGIEGVDFEAVDPTEGIKALAKSVKDTHTKLAEDLAAAKKGGAPSKELEQLQASLDAKAREVEALRTNAKEWEGKYVELDTTIKTRESKAREDAFYDSALEGIQFRADVNKFAIDGFKLALRQQYKPDFTDGTPKVLDKEGKIVMDPTKAQTFRSMSDIAKELAEKEKLIGGEVKPAIRKVISTTAAGMGGMTTKTPPEGAVRGRRVMPVE